MKLAIITEFLYFKGGIEKSILALIEELDKKGIEFDIYAGLYDPAKTFEGFKKYKIRAFRKDKLPEALNGIYLRYKFSRLRLKGYDGYVLFGSHSISAAKRHHPNVLWSTRPLAYVYGWDGKGPDKNTQYLFGKNIFRNFAVWTYLKVLRWFDQREIKHVDEIRTVGILAKRALEKAYPNNRTKILYAPIPIENYSYIGKGKHYINVARHVPDKNVDRIVKAFQLMPDKKLIQIGEFSDNAVSDMAKGYPNIKILGFKNEKDLRELMGNSIAMISASEGEDFSMNLMESLASGKPTISVSIEGDSKMRAIDTGVLMPNSQPDEIMHAVNFLTKERADKMRKACEIKSKQFSKDNFVNGILSALGVI